jgi:hypothetical protein
MEVRPSVVGFPDGHPEVTAYAKARGWDQQPGHRVDVYDADLVFTTDNWKTTKTAKLQHLLDGSRGFLLQDVPPGSKIEYAIHAHLALTYNNHRFTAERGDTWLNNGGSNYTGDTQKPF